MSSLSRTLARASARENPGLMRKYQYPGAYQEGEQRYKEERAKKQAKQKQTKKLCRMFKEEVQRGGI